MQQIKNDQEALAQRNEVDRALSDIAESAVLVVRGKVGLVVTLGTYALSHAKPCEELPKAVLSAGTGIIEGGIFRAGAHVGEKAAHTIIQHAKELLWKSPANTSVLLEILPQTVICRPPASAAEVSNTVNQLMGHVTQVDSTGPLFIAEHNAHFGNADKALLYHQAYEQMFSRAHLIFLEEVDPEFCRTTAAGINYKWCASRVNSRGQGLGFLLHPRLELVGEPVTLESVAQVHHIPDLRPGFMLHLKDVYSGAQFNALAVHLKSMRGGAYTQAIRYAQTKSLLNSVGDCPTIIGGDWNCFLDRSTKEITPLQQAGFQLVDPLNHAPTQEFGGRLDGFMTRNFPWGVGNCENFNFWQQLPACSFSDHGLIRTRMYVARN